MITLESVLLYCLFWELNIKTDDKYYEKKLFHPILLGGDFFLQVLLFWVIPENLMTFKIFKKRPDL